MNNSDQSHMPRIAIVVPTYNEELNLQTLHAELRKVMLGLQYRFTIIYVNDGSTDTTRQQLEQFAASEDNVTAIHFSRNFGHQAALIAGMEEAARTDADAVITIDADMQHPPALIPQLIEKWSQGYAIVYTVRDDTSQTPLFKRLTSRAFYRLTSALTDTPIPRGAADFRLISRQALLTLLALPERALVIRSLSSWIGFAQIGVHYTPAPRLAGTSHYSFNKMLRLALDTLISSSTKPLRIVVIAGLVLSFLAGAYTLWILYAHIFTQRTIPGWSSVMAAILLLGGVNLSVIGMVGIYVAKVFEEVKRRPHYVIQSRSKETPKQ